MADSYQMAAAEIVGKHPVAASRPDASEVIDDVLDDASISEFFDDDNIDNIIDNDAVWMLRCRKNNLTPVICKIQQLQKEYPHDRNRILFDSLKALVRNSILNGEHISLETSTFNMLFADRITMSCPDPIRNCVHRLNLQSSLFGYAKGTSHDRYGATQNIRSDVVFVEITVIATLIGLAQATSGFWDHATKTYKSL